MAIKSLWDYYVQASRVLDLLFRILLTSRRTRALSHYGETRSLYGLNTYRDYAISKLDAVQPHYLRRQAYLHSSFGIRERVECILCHYRFEETHFDAGYKSAVYEESGLPLWTHSGEGHSFMIRLQRESSSELEGELTISLIANGSVLHRISFAWINGNVFGIAGNSIPFITRNERCSADSAEALAAFESCFGTSAPDSFCMAAMQGVAQSLGVNNLLAINYDSQVTFEPKEVAQFQRAYDGYWKVLGAVRLRSGVWFLRIPFYTKPMREISSKNRKRTATRRRQWDAVSESTRVAIQNRLSSNSPNEMKDREVIEFHDL